MGGDGGGGGGGGGEGRSSIDQDHRRGTPTTTRPNSLHSSIHLDPTFNVVFRYSEFLCQSY